MKLKQVYLAHSFNNFVSGQFPIFIWDLPGNNPGIYGFPAIDGPSGGLKIASEDYSDTVTPNNVERNVSPDEVSTMYEKKIAPYFPKIGSHCLKSVVCLYTVTPDNGFIIDRHPPSAKIILCSPCSGHGFKHSAAIGECIAQLIATGKSSINISAFALNRFTKELAY